jgi:hypothetical protein
VVQLVALFNAAAQACREKYRQECTLSTKAPIYRLLRTNEPDVSRVEREGGNVVFLGDIAGLLTEEGRE